MLRRNDVQASAHVNIPESLPSRCDFLCNKRFVRKFQYSIIHSRCEGNTIWPESLSRDIFAEICRSNENNLIVVEVSSGTAPEKGFVRNKAPPATSEEESTHPESERKEERD
jgi:hypothetical protein